jgi:hypothetical protein
LATIFVGTRLITTSAIRIRAITADMIVTTVMIAARRMVETDLLVDRAGIRAAGPVMADLMGDLMDDLTEDLTEDLVVPVGDPAHRMAESNR